MRIRRQSASHALYSPPGAALAACRLAVLVWTVAALMPPAPPAAALRGEEVLADVPVLTFEREVGLTPAGDGCAGTLRVWQTPEGAREGRYGVCCSYAIQEGAGAVVLRGPVELPGCPQALRLWVRGNGSGLALAARLVDAKGNSFRLLLGRIDFTGWRSLTADLGTAQPEGSPAGRPPPAPPIRLSELRIEGVAIGMAGVLHLDTVAVTTWLAPPQQTPVALVPAAPGGLFSAGDPAALTLQARNLTDRPVVADVWWRADDYVGRRAAAGALDLRLPPFGEAEQDLKIPTPAAGVYTVTAEVRRPGMASWTVSRRVVIVPPPSSAGQGREPAFGVCVSEPGSPEVRALVAASGARWVRPSCSWPQVEPEPGVYTFPADLDDWLSGLQPLGIGALVALECQNPAYDSGEFPRSAETVAAFARFCRAVAQRWGRTGPVRAWEIGPGLVDRLRGVPPAGYVRLLRTARAAIRQVDPKALVVGCLTDGSDLSVLDGVLRAGGAEAMDAVGVHLTVPASQDAAAGLMERLRRVQAVLRLRGAGTKPIWVTRLTALPGEGTTQRDVAAFLAQAQVEILGESHVKAVFWSAFCDGSAGGEPAQHQAAGLVEADGFPRPALLAVRAAADQLAGMPCRERHDDDGVCSRRFDGSDRAVAALWSRQGELLCAVRTNAPRAVVTDAMGNARAEAATENVVLLPVSEAPCYVRVDRAATVTVQPILSGPAEAPRIRAGDVAIVPISVHQPFRTIGMGAVRVEAPPGWHAAVQELEGERPDRGRRRLLVRVHAPGDAPGGVYHIRLGVDFDRAGLPGARLEVPVYMGPGR